MVQIHGAIPVKEVSEMPVRKDMEREHAGNLRLRMTEQANNIGISMSQNDIAESSAIASAFAEFSAEKV